MARPKHASATLPPAPGLRPTGPAWDEAFLRVATYLRAYQPGGRLRLDQLVTEIVREARVRADQAPGVAPVTLAMEIALARIEAWLARIEKEEGEEHERERAHGRLALLLANGTGQWADYFLSSAPPPPGLITAMASSRFQPGPELRFSNMPPAPLEFGFDDEAPS